MNKKILVTTLALAGLLVVGAGAEDVTETPAETGGWFSDIWKNVKTEQNDGWYCEEVTNVENDEFIPIGYDGEETTNWCDTNWDGYFYFDEENDLTINENWEEDTGSNWHDLNNAEDEPVPPMVGEPRLGDANIPKSEDLVTDSDSNHAKVTTTYDSDDAIYGTTEDDSDVVDNTESEETYFGEDSIAIYTPPYYTKTTQSVPVTSSVNNSDFYNNLFKHIKDFGKEIVYEINTPEPPICGSSNESPTDTSLINRAWKEENGVTLWTSIPPESWRGGNFIRFVYTYCHFCEDGRCDEVRIGSFAIKFDSDNPSLDQLQTAAELAHEFVDCMGLNNYYLNISIVTNYLTDDSSTSDSVQYYLTLGDNGIVNWEYREE